MKLHARIMREVMQPTADGLISDGTPYIGFLYAGIIDRAGRHAERARIQLPLRRSGNAAHRVATHVPDLTALCEAALDGRLDQVTAEWDPRAALGVVLAAGGYPDSVRKGDEIHGLEGSRQHCPAKCFMRARR